VLVFLLIGSLSNSAPGDTRGELIEWSIGTYSGIVCGDTVNFAAMDSIESDMLLMFVGDWGWVLLVGEVVDSDVREAIGGEC